MQKDSNSKISEGPLQQSSALAGFIAQKVALSIGLRWNLSLHEWMSARMEDTILLSKWTSASAFSICCHWLPYYFFSGIFPLWACTLCHHISSSLCCVFFHLKKTFLFPAGRIFSTLRSRARSRKSCILIWCYHNQTGHALRGQQQKRRSRSANGEGQKGRWPPANRLDARGSSREVRTPSTVHDSTRETDCW